MRDEPNSMRRWSTLDRGIACYAVLTAALIAARHDSVTRPLPLLGFHVAVLLLLVVLPPRGAAWESGPSREPVWQSRLRRTARFFRYTYPSLLLIPFFEEVERFVNAIAPESPYWFEPLLYATDRWLFGALPATLLSGWVGRVQDEVMHAFYLTYYPIVTAGLLIAWAGPRTGRIRFPGPGFERTITALVLAQLLAFIWYPWLPARGPWEDPVLMAELPPFAGPVFVPLVERIIATGAVSGGCFPSAHVAGTWGVVIGLAPTHRRAALVFGAIAIGMSLACPYTRYHHAIDVPAGLVTGILGAWLAGRSAPADHAPI